ncbi:molecular chaperone [Dulcicalothrix desertica PCC 7102]|uniref:Molecular chaperone n=2 Tax=Dulcicalothrix desertica TaxID=32056 RepID=A0A3S1CMW3_9CYAN|nr:molecular chaperone [Dulcicalothrix desertica PCC 7102]
MDRMFDEIFGGSSYNLPAIQKPNIELRDTNDSLILRAEIAGIDGKDLEVHVARQAVLIKGEIHYHNNSNEQGFYHTEFQYGKFERVINLPIPVKNEQVNAEFKNGILTLILPKDQDTKSKVVKINFGDDNRALPGSNAPWEAPKILDVPVQKA